VSFYHDQGTHHAAALTYYALMSLFPTLLLAVSLLGILGEYPGTYNSIIRHLRGVVPADTLAPLDAALRAALKSKGTAAVALALAVLTVLYGVTGYLEAARRALNVIFGAQRGRSFVRRKLIDIGSTFVLLALSVTSVVLSSVCLRGVGAESSGRQRRQPSSTTNPAGSRSRRCCKQRGPDQIRPQLQSAAGGQRADL
jgi:membrane protein